MQLQYQVMDVVGAPKKRKFKLPTANPSGMGASPSIVERSALMLHDWAWQTAPIGYAVSSLALLTSLNTNSYPRQRPEERELVGGTLVVVQDDVPQEWQGARTIVRQLDSHLRPPDLLATKLVVDVGAVNDKCAVISGKGAVRRMRTSLSFRR